MFYYFMFVLYHCFVHTSAVTQMIENKYLFAFHNFSSCTEAFLSLCKNLIKCNINLQHNEKWQLIFGLFIQL